VCVCVRAERLCFEAAALGAYVMNDIYTYIIFTPFACLLACFVQNIKTQVVISPQGEKEVPQTIRDESSGRI
jgi:hypothetical protein